LEAKVKASNIWAKLFGLIIIFVMLLGSVGCGAEKQPTDQELAATLLSALPIVAMQDGQVYGAGAGTNVWAIWKVLQGSVNTFVMAKDGLVLFAAPTAMDELGNCRWWFTVIETKRFQLVSDVVKNVPTLGNITNATTFSDLMRNLEANGWSLRKPDDVSWPFLVTLKAALGYLMSSSSTALTDFLVVPVFMIDPANSPVIPVIIVD
jgi:hypothetical protein